MRILLLEDDADLAEVVALGLRNESYAVDVARTCADAEEVLQTTEFDVACIDLGLPDGDGLDLVRRLSQDPDLRRPRRSLVLTARDGVAAGSPDSTPVPTTTSSSHSTSRSWSPDCGRWGVVAMLTDRHCRLVS
jgi:hypothetical protein